MKIQFREIKEIIACILIVSMFMGIVVGAAGAEEDSVNEGELSVTEAVDENIKGESLLHVEGMDAPGSMKINLLEYPFGVTREALSFSWINSYDNGMSSQKAYRIVISSREADVKNREYIYDSGWVESSQNTSVQLDLSSVLEENELYYWQVQTQNQKGNRSILSEPQAFSTAIEDQWASKQGIWGSKDQKTVFLRQQL